jgi:hypothetical protein
MFFYLLFVLPAILLVRRRFGIHDTIRQHFSTRGNPTMSTPLRRNSSQNAGTDSDSDIEYEFEASSPRFTRHQVYETSFVLRQKLPLELVTPILNYAEYWLRNTYACDEVVDVHQQNFNRGNCKYLCTTPIGNDGLSGIKRVKKVVFVTESKDQGWSSYPDDHGTYQGSWTWFEVRAGDADAVEDNCEGNRDDREQMNGYNDSRAPEEPRWMAGEGREVTRNIHAGKGWHRHVITWAAADEDENGEWVRKLRKGQVIILSAHARFVYLFTLQGSQ